MECIVCRQKCFLFFKIWDDNINKNIHIVIQEHLQWLKPLEREKGEAAICQKCWSHLEDFHNFYMEVKKANNDFKQKIGEYNESKIDGNAKLGDKNNDFCDETGTIADRKKLEMPVQTARKAKEELRPSTLKEAFESFKADESDYEEISSKNVDALYKNVDDTPETKLIESQCKEQMNEYKSVPLKTSQHVTAKISFNLENLLQRSNGSENEIIKKYIVMACELCAFIGKDFNEVAKHLKDHHDIMKPYIKCCGRKLNKKYKILEHAYKHYDPDYFKCKECDKVFADSNILKTHYLANHAPEEILIFSCDKCPKRFSRQHFLDLHISSHIPESERKYFCQQCPHAKPFASEHKLQIHFNMRHKRATNICHVCAKVIRDKQSFEKHVRLHFEDSGPRVKCPRPDCDSWLKDEDNLKQHLRRHNDEGKKFICPKCDKSCKNRRALSSHLSYSHTSETFSCDDCKKTFKKAISLKEHMAQHTGEALYKCPFCTRTFNSNANMHSHKKRMHPSEWEHWRKTKTVSAQKTIISNKSTKLKTLELPKIKVPNELNINSSMHMFSSNSFLVFP